MSFPRYPKYKASGVEWLGALPEHWSVQPLKYNSYVKGRVGWQNLRSEEFTGEGPFLITGMHFKDGSVDWDQCYHITETRYAMAPEIQVKVDDVLITKDGSIGKLAHLRELPGAASLNSHLLVIRPLWGRYRPRFLYLLLSSVAFRTHIDLHQSGTTFFGISQESVIKFPVVLPSISEQATIASFLDRETAKIDGLVAEQQRLIELLKEKRQAVISHAVTKGLNPHAPMKPSGINWLGDVPEHWTTRTIAKASTKITNGYVGPTRDILVESGTPYIQATHIKRGCITFDDGYFVTSEWSHAHAKSILATGDVLIVQTGAGTGDVAVVTEDEVGFNCHALIIVASDPNALSGFFLAQVLQSDYGRQVLESIQTGGMHPHLNCGNVKYVEIPLPPTTEQAAIVKHIAAVTERLDVLTAEAKRSIDLLEERRTALISAAVTGKIDVRGLVETEAA